MAYKTLTKEFKRVDTVLYYQIDCLEKHPEIPALPLHISIQEDCCAIEADISGKISLTEYLAGRSLVREDWLRLLIAAGEIVRHSKECFLDPERFAFSLNEIYLPSALERFDDKELRFLYIPILPDMPGDYSKDPLLALSKEVLRFLSSDRNFCEEMFSIEEEEQIASWSADFAEQGLDAFRVMLEGRIPQGDCVHAEIKNEKPLFSRTFHPFPNVVIPFPVLFILSAEAVLIVFAFQIMKNQPNFHNPATPVLLLSAILICCAGLDLFLILKRQSLFHISRPSDIPCSDYTDLEADTESLSEAVFSIKEEKTVLLCPSTGSRRIAMLSSGIPGTLEEGKGQKAYILSDDFLIGRDCSKVDFRINSLTVGRIHARILRRENSFFMEDLGSRNGTFVNQKKLKKKEEFLLPENCRIRFADKEFYFVAD